MVTLRYLKLRFADDSGQQMVEMALVTPVFLLALVLVFNTLLFMSECARFDRVSAEVIRSGVNVRSGEGQSRLRASLESGMGYTAASNSRFSVEVLEPQHLNPTKLGFDYMRITCRLNYRPWPSPDRTFRFPGMGSGARIVLAPMHHDKSLVVDHYMPGGLF